MRLRPLPLMALVLGLLLRLFAISINTNDTRPLPARLCLSPCLFLFLSSHSLTLILCRSGGGGDVQWPASKCSPYHHYSRSFYLLYLQILSQICCDKWHPMIKLGLCVCECLQLDASFTRTFTLAQQASSIIMVVVHTLQTYFAALQHPTYSLEMMHSGHRTD